MVIINLRKVFRARGIAQPFKLLVKSGINPHTAHRLLNQKTASLKLTHLEQVCVMLNCNPHDILEWIPTDLLEDRPDHPLQIIRRKEKTIPWPRDRFRMNRIERREKRERRKKG